MPPASPIESLKRWLARLTRWAADAPAAPSPTADRVRQAWRQAQSAGRRAIGAGRAWLGEPANVQRLARVLVPVLVVAGLVLPPISLITRVTTLGYGKLQPGRDAAVASDVPGIYFEARGRAVTRAARVDLSSTGGLPRGVDPLPQGRELLTPILRLDIRGPAPREGWLAASIDVGADGHAFLDPYGWDGAQWQWLPMQAEVANQVRVRLPLQDFVPVYVVITRADRATTAVSAVLLPPPAAAPAAVAELPILEMRAYAIETDDGHVTGQRFRIPSRRAKVYGVVDNVEGLRVRSDLVNNVLIQRDARQRHRDVLVNLVRRDGLSGLVLDYRGIAGDLQGVYAGWLGRLRDDLHRLDAELYITVPMPRQSGTDWDDSPYAWHSLAPRVDGVRVLLPPDAPLETEALDGMVRWALQSVPRDKLQLALTVQGRDIVDDDVTAIGYGEALAKVLDMAQSDAPGRINPGSASFVELPTIRAAELGRDPATGMWRFYYWDSNRRQHTVWLNDADGLKPAFDIARAYLLSRVVLDGVEAGLDPNLWRMTQDFIAKGEATAPRVSYQLQWQLVDSNGHVVQQASQPVETPAFAFDTPSRQGLYRLGVNLLTADDRLAAVGRTFEINVAPPPAATPRPTDMILVIVPTPIPVITAPPPADEALIRRTPVRIEAGPVAEGTAEAGARVAAAEAPLRSAPSVGEGDVISTMRIGTGLEVLGRSADGTWLEVRVIATGIQGWVLRDLIDTDLSPAAIDIVSGDAAATVSAGNRATPRP